MLYYVFVRPGQKSSNRNSHENKFFPKSLAYVR